MRLHRSIMTFLTPWIYFVYILLLLIVILSEANNYLILWWQLISLVFLLWESSCLLSLRIIGNNNLLITQTHLINVTKSQDLWLSNFRVGLYQGGSERAYTNHSHFLNEFFSAKMKHVQHQIEHLRTLDAKVLHMIWQS